jgi:prostaglandin-endoperoxide synthase 2
MGIFDEALGGLSNIPHLGNKLSELAINHIATRTTERPRPFSLWSADPVVGDTDTGPVSDYTSWPSLTDRSFSGRHLPPAALPDLAKLKSKPEDLAPLFMRGAGPMVEDRSSVLFMFFAQWFTDSVLRVNRKDRRRNTSNHDIDLCQIYGLNEATACLLRSQERGRLRSQEINGEEFPEYLYEQTGEGTPLKIKEHFQDLSYVADLDFIFAQTDVERRRKAYATGLERGNSTIGYAAINTLFLREHNRIAGQLEANNPGWDDERLFQTARMINIVLLMKVVVEDYINHIAGVPIFDLSVGFAEKQRWYRQNWIAIEFDMLYRWHSLVPDEIRVGDKSLKPKDFLVNNGLLEEKGLGAVLKSASAQRAGRIGLRNTPSFLAPAELATLKMNRNSRLQPYNAYRVQFCFEPLGSFEELTSDPDVLASLKASYDSIDQVDFIVGIFAEDRKGGALFGDLLGTMVAYDAFTQIFTNPLLSTHVFNTDTFTQYGMDLIENTRSVQDIAKRNVKGGDVRASLGA